MNNRDRKQAIADFIGDMEGKDYTLVEHSTDKLMFVPTLPAGKLKFPVTFTKQAIEDIIHLANTDLNA